MSVTKCQAKFGAQIAFGALPSLPLRGFPEGKARIRARNDEFVKVWIRTEGGIREFAVNERDGFWEPFLETGFNSNAECSGILSAAKEGGK